MDLALVLDGSDSVGNADFEKLKNWSKSFIENLQVDKYGAKVGVIKYATSIKDVSPMSSDIEDIKVSIYARKGGKYNSTYLYLDTLNGSGLIKKYLRDELIESAGFKVTQTLVQLWNVFELNYLPKVDAKMSQKLSLWSPMVSPLTLKNSCPKLPLSRSSSLCSKHVKGIHTF